MMQQWADIKENQLEILGLENIMGEIRKLILDGWSSIVDRDIDRTTLGEAGPVCTLMPCVHACIHVCVPPDLR